MRILTPTEAAFTPSGQINLETILASATVSQNITADTSYGPSLFVTVPESGPYLAVIYAETLNSTAATGTFTGNLNNNGGPAVAFSQSITGTWGTNDCQFVTVFTDLEFTFEWAVTGFTTGSADIKIVASVIRLA